MFSALRISSYSPGIVFNSFRQQIFNQRAGIKTLEEKIGLPPRPKKPLTPYFRYMKELRPKIMTENPKSSIMDITRIIALQWKTIDEETKQKLQDDYKKDQIVYVEQRAKYDKQITDEKRTELEQLKLDIVEAKERKAMRKRVKELGRPKRPASAFFRFISNERITNPQKSDQTYRQWHQDALIKWKQLPDEDKTVYCNAAKIDLEKHQKEMSIWEQKMIRLGHIDVVRNEALIDPAETKSNTKKVPKLKKI